MHEELLSLGIKSEEVEVFIGVLKKVEIDANALIEIDECINDPFMFEGGGPGIRELLLLLAYQLKQEDEVF